MAEQKQEYSNALTRAEGAFLSSAFSALENNGVKIDNYSRQCAAAMIVKMQEALSARGTAWNAVEQSGITQALQMVAALKLNANASPRECYVILRNVFDKAAKTYKSVFEFGIEGDGFDALLRNFGAGVKTVHKYWEVREKDKFTYPKMRGLEISPPEWEPTGIGKIVRVVYPVEKLDGNVEYLISERADVKKNLLAHINQNLMNEAFEFGENRYDKKLTDAQKIEIEQRKAGLKREMNTLDLDDILDCGKYDKWISPAWMDGHSRDSMILRKMRNNAVKKYPKAFNAAAVGDMLNSAIDEGYAQAARDKRENANAGEPIVINTDEYEVVDESAGEEAARE